MRQSVSDFAQGWRFSHESDGQTELAWTDLERDLLGFEPTTVNCNSVTWSKAGKCYGYASPDFDDDDWRTVTLPHDWCVENAPEQSAPIRNGFLHMGVGWYRRNLDIPKDWLGQKIEIQFDGVFRDATVFLNGHYVARNESGYIGFEARLDPLLNYGGENVLCVRVDARSKEGWFYEGCGIYRAVRLVVSDPLHLVTDGVHARCELINGDRPTLGDVTLSAEIANDHDTRASFNLVQTVTDPHGSEVARLRRAVELEPGETTTVSQRLELRSPVIWSIDRPHLYHLRTSLERGQQLIDAVSTTFGLRTATFDGTSGFKLNGKPIKLRGVCCHQDHAGVGMAIPVGLQVWRLEQLKAMGANAYRCAHNPPDPAVLDACDRLGILVIDETRAFGISDEHISQAVRMLRRDRNHPCIIAWSLANEEMAVQVTEAGSRMFVMLKQRLRLLDDTRPFTAAVNSGWDAPQGFIEHVDLHGLNYLNQGDLEELRRHAPDMPVVVSEAASAVSTRGEYVTDPEQGVVTSYDNHVAPDHHKVHMWPFWGRSAEASWQAIANRPDLAGTFVWTGFDYRGEQSPYVRWPAVGSHFGIMDQCGFPKDEYWYYRAWWSDEPVLHLLPHWNWGGREGETVNVWCYSNATRVRLALNEQDLGEQSMPANGHVEWAVPYQPGELVAIGVWPDGSVATTTRRTVGRPTGIELQPQRPNLTLGDEQTIIISARVVDHRGQIVPDAMHHIAYSLHGPAKILGIGNGDPNDHHPNRLDTRHAIFPVFHGLAQLILRVDPMARLQDVTLAASANGLIDHELRLDTKTSCETAACLVKA